MVIKERGFSVNDSYRFGFNGKENDNDVKGEGNQQDYGMRIYDPRLGRFLSVDPLTKNYPSWSPYPFAMNRPIDGVDLDGEEWKCETTTDPSGCTTIIYDIKIYLGEKNTLSLDNPNEKEILDIIKSEAENILSRNVASGTIEDPIVKVNITFTNEKSEFQINFREFVSVSKFNKKGEEGFSGDPFANGYAQIGETQINNINIATSNTLLSSSVGGITLSKTYVNSPEDMGRSLAHELGHTAGLRHPFDENNDIEEIDNRTGDPELIKKNFINSAGNEKYPSNDGKEIIPKQRKKIEQTVKDQQTK